MASPTQWTWVWASSRSWWWTGKSGMWQSLGWQSQTWLSDWTELNWMGTVSCKTGPESEVQNSCLLTVCVHHSAQPKLPASGCYEGKSCHLCMNLEQHVMSPPNTLQELRSKVYILACMRASKLLLLGFSLSGCLKPILSLPCGLICLMSSVHLSTELIVFSYVYEWCTCFKEGIYLIYFCQIFLSFDFQTLILTYIHNSYEN